MEKIKLNINGNSDLTSQNWEEGWDAVHVFAEGMDKLATDDSKVEGKIKVSVASKSEVEKINSDSRSSGVIEVDDTIQQFEDKEVCKVITDNAGGGTTISKGIFSRITDISTWFQDNDKIESYDELGETSVTKLSSRAFNGCVNLKRIDVSRITSLSRALSVFEGVAVKKFEFDNLTIADNSYNNFINVECVLYAPKLKKDISAIVRNGATSAANRVIAAFFPALTNYNGSYIHVGGMSAIIDLGKFTAVIGSSHWNYDGEPIATIIRSTEVPDCTITGANPSRVTRPFFVEKDLYDEYMSNDSWSYVASTGNIHIIGDSLWQETMRSFSEEYAKEYAGWTEEQISNADYSDPYIDYDIFGVPRPE